VLICVRRMAALRFPGRIRQKWDNASFLARPTLPAISRSFTPGVSKRTGRAAQAASNK
jgi:hypothetical protein